MSSYGWEPSAAGERGGGAAGGELGIRPVDIAIGDGKNVSVNVTALSVPFSHKGSSPQAAWHAGDASSAEQQHDIQLQYASARRNTHSRTHWQQQPFNPTSRSVKRKRTRGKRQSERAEMKVSVLSCWALLLCNYWFFPSCFCVLVFFFLTWMQKDRLGSNGCRNEGAYAYKHKLAQILPPLPLYRTRLRFSRYMLALFIRGVPKKLAQGKS